MTTKTTEMNDVLTKLEQASYGTAPFEELPILMQNMIINKLHLTKLIEEGIITDVKKAEHWLEIIETVYEWSSDDSLGYNHSIEFFEDGNIHFQTTRENYWDEFWIDYIDDKLLLNDVEHDSINSIMNEIEYNVGINYY